MDKNLVTVILAAGGSTRMNKPKQLLKWKENTLIENSIITSESINRGKNMIVLGSKFNKIFKTVSKYNIRIINNKKWKNGIGSSISIAIKNILNDDHQIDGVLFVLADQPFVSKKYLEKMIKEFKKNKIVVTKYGEKNGIPAIFSKLFFNELLELNEDFGAKKIISQNKESLIILKPDPNTLVDIDTPEDYNNFI